MIRVAGGIYDYSDCRVGGVTINIPLQDEPDGSTLETAVALVGGEASQFIRFTFLFDSDALRRGPLKVNVESISFGNDAMLTFFGRLPPGSSLLVKGNSFSLTQRSPYEENNARIDNTLTAILFVGDGSGPFASPFMISGGTGITVRGNRIGVFLSEVDSTEASEGFGMVRRRVAHLIRFTGTNIVVSQHSVVTVENNEANLDPMWSRATPNAKGMVLLSVASLLAVDSIVINTDALIDISGNSVRNPTRRYTTQRDLTPEEAAAGGGGGGAALTYGPTASVVQVINVTCTAALTAAVSSVCLNIGGASVLRVVSNFINATADYSPATPAVGLGAQVFSLYGRVEVSSDGSFLHVSGNKLSQLVVTEDSGSSVCGVGGTLAENARVDRSEPLHRVAAVSIIGGDVTVWNGGQVFIAGNSVASVTSGAGCCHTLRLQQAGRKLSIGGVEEGASSLVKISVNAMTNTHCGGGIAVFDVGSSLFLENDGGGMMASAAGAIDVINNLAEDLSSAVAVIVISLWGYEVDRAVSDVDVTASKTAVRVAGTSSTIVVSGNVATNVTVRMGSLGGGGGNASHLVIDLIRIGATALSIVNGGQLILSANRLVGASFLHLSGGGDVDSTSAARLVALLPQSASRNTLVVHRGGAALIIADNAAEALSGAFAVAVIEVSSFDGGATVGGEASFTIQGNTVRGAFAGNGSFCAVSFQWSLQVNEGSALVIRGNNVSEVHSQKMAVFVGVRVAAKIQLESNASFAVVGNNAALVAAGETDPSQPQASSGFVIIGSVEIDASSGKGSRLSIEDNTISIVGLAAAAATVQGTQQAAAMVTPNAIYVASYSASVSTPGGGGSADSSLHIVGNVMSLLVLAADPLDPSSSPPNVAPSATFAVIGNLVGIALAEVSRNVLSANCSLRLTITFLAMPPSGAFHFSGNTITQLKTAEPTPLAAAWGPLTGGLLQFAVLDESAPFGGAGAGANSVLPSRISFVGNDYISAQFHAPPVAGFLITITGSLIPPSAENAQRLMTRFFACENSFNGDRGRALSRRLGPSRPFADVITERYKNDSSAIYVCPFGSSPSATAVIPSVTNPLALTASQTAQATTTRSLAVSESASFELQSLTVSAHRTLSRSGVTQASPSPTIGSSSQSPSGGPQTSTVSNLRTATGQMTITPKDADSSKSLTATPSMTDENGPSVTVETTPTRTARRLAPIPAPRVEEAARVVATVTGPPFVLGIIAGSGVGGQLGVANALARMGSCGGEEEKDEEEEDALPVLVHPLGFRIGPGEDGLYVGAAISNALIIPAVFAALLRGPLYASLRLRIAGGMSHGAALTAIGWPAALALPFTTLAEGTAAAVVRSARAGRSYSIAAAVVAAIATVLFSVNWLRILLRVIPRGAVELTTNDGAAANSSNENEANPRREEQERETKGAEGVNSAGVAPEAAPNSHPSPLLRMPLLASEDAPDAANDATPADPTADLPDAALAARLLLWVVTPTRLWAPVEGRWGAHGHVLPHARGQSGREKWPGQGNDGGSGKRPLVAASTSGSGRRRRSGGNDGYDGPICAAVPMMELSGGHPSDNGSRDMPPFGNDTARAMEGESTGEGDGAFLNPTFSESAVAVAAAEETLERYGDSTLGDKRWYYAEILSFGCSLLVGAMEGLPDTSSARWCRGRAIVALAAAVAQCVCGCAALVPLEAFLQGLMTAAVVPMAVAVTAKAFWPSDDFAGRRRLDESIAALSAAANIVGLALLAATVALSGIGALLGRPSSSSYSTHANDIDISQNAKNASESHWLRSFIAEAALRFKASGRRIRRRLRSTLLAENNEEGRGSCPPPPPILGEAMETENNNSSSGVSSGSATEAVPSYAQLLPIENSKLGPARDKELFVQEAAKKTARANSLRNADSVSTCNKPDAVAGPPVRIDPPPFHQRTLDEADAIDALKTREERMAWAAARGGMKI